MDALKKRVVELGYDLEITSSAADFIAERGYDEKYGARPLKRAIQKYLEDPFAEEIINSDVAEGDLLRADLEQGKDDLTIQVIKGGLLTMPEGAEEALSGAQTASKKKPSDSAKKPKKRATKKKDDNQGEMPTDSEA